MTTPLITPGLSAKPVAIELFRCMRLATKLTRASCGERHAAAQRGPGGAGGVTHNPCRSCPIGEAHERGESHPDAPADVVPVATLLERGRAKLFKPATAGELPAKPGGDCIECGASGHTWETCPRFARGKAIERAARAANKDSGAVAGKDAEVRVEPDHGVAPRATGRAAEERPAASPAALDGRERSGGVALPRATKSANDAPTAKPAPREDTMETTQKKCVMCGATFSPQARADVARFCPAHSAADRAKWRYHERTGAAGKSAAKNGGNGRPAAKPVRARAKNGNGTRPRTGTTGAPMPPAQTSALSSPASDARAALELLGYEVLDERTVPRGRLILVADGVGE